MISQYERSGSGYTEIDVILFPNLLAQKQEYTIGKYGRQHLRYLMENRRVLYTNLKTTGKLNSYPDSIGYTNFFYQMAITFIAVCFLTNTLSALV